MSIVNRHSLGGRVRGRMVVAALLCSVVVQSMVVGVVPSSASTTPTSGPQWSAGTTLVANKGGVDVVSCVAATFCVAGDHTGDVSYFNGSSWSTPQNIDGANAITAIACPTTTFCVATDAIGQYVTMTGSTWSSPVPFHPFESLQMLGVSCSSPLFCMAVGETSNFTPVDYYYNNGVWTLDSVNLGPGDNSAFDAVSCAPTDVCLATDFGGNVTTFTLSAGSTPTFSHTTTKIDPTDQTYIANSISCVTATSCVAGSNSNMVSTFNGVSWTTVTPFLLGANGVLVSCVATTCVANDSNAQAVSSSVPFTTWSTPGTITIPSQINGVSCYAVLASAACQAVDNDGFSVALTLGTNGVPLYTPSTTVFDPPHVLSSVTCASATYCIAGDTAGETVTYQNAKWSSPQVITTQPLGVREVRCASSTHPFRALQCAAVIGDYAAYHLGSHTATWKPEVGTSTTYAISCSSRCEYLSPEGKSSGLVGGYLPKLPPNAIVTDVSCPASAHACMAIDSSGDFYVSRGATWSIGPRIESSKTVVAWSLSCVSTSFCVAIDLSGDAYEFNGTSWSRPEKISALGLYAVSCGATYLCVATDLLGGAHVFNGTRWLTTKSGFTSGALHGVSCPSASTCVAVDSSKAYTLSIPTVPTHISYLASTRAESVEGRTVVKVSVTAATAPTGTVTISAGTVTCAATLKKVTAGSSRAHCTLRTTRSGPTRFVTVFGGSYGYAPSGPRDLVERVLAAK